MKKMIICLMAALIIVPGCGNMNQTTSGSLIGGGAGAAVGAGIGALIGKGKGAAIGAAIGGAVGSGAGYVIGRKMDKKAEQLQKELENAKVETVTDVNGLEAIKITFESGLLFKTGKSDLSTASKNDLAKFATSMKDMTDTDITIYGHTDNTGSAAVNEKLSNERAGAVKNYLKTQGIADGRMISEGKSYNEPVADNSTEAGRAQNRRVEVYVTANKAMIDKAEAGTLN